MHGCPIVSLSVVRTLNPFRGKWVLLDGDKIAALCAAFIHEELAKLGLDKVRLEQLKPQFPAIEAAMAELKRANQILNSIRCTLSAY